MMTRDQALHLISFDIVSNWEYRMNAFNSRTFSVGGSHCIFEGFQMLLNRIRTYYPLAFNITEQGFGSLRSCGCIVASQIA